MSNEARDNLYQQLYGANSTAPPTQPNGDRGAESLGRLDAHGLAALRSIVLAVIDRYPWQFYPDGDEWEKETPETNAERLAFCDAIAAEIVRRAAPATAGGRGK